MDATQVVSASLAAVTVLGGLLAYFKYKPGQREAVDMNIAQANMNVAQGTFQLVTTELEDQFKRMSAELRTVREQAAAELADLRREFNQYRIDTDLRLAEQAAEVRAARAGEREAQRQAEAYMSENEHLRERVKALETEVATLKANGRP